MPNPVFTYTLNICFGNTFCRYTQLDLAEVICFNVISRTLVGVGSVGVFILQAHRLGDFCLVFKESYSL